MNPRNSFSNTLIQLFIGGMSIFLIAGCCTGPNIIPQMKYRRSIPLPISVALKFEHEPNQIEKDTFCRVFRQSGIFKHVVCKPTSRIPVNLVLRIYRTAIVRDTSRETSYVYTWLTTTFCLFLAADVGKLTYWYGFEKPNRKSQLTRKRSRQCSVLAKSHRVECTSWVSWAALLPFWRPAMTTDGRCMTNVWKELTDMAAVRILRAISRNQKKLKALGRKHKPTLLRNARISTSSKAQTSNAMPNIQEKKEVAKRIRNKNRKTIIAVFNIEDVTKRFKKSTTKQLTEYLSARLTEVAGYKVLPRKQIQKRLVREKRRGYKSCYDETCQIEMGKALAAHKSLATKLLRIGDRCAITSNILDLRTESSEKAASLETDCSTNSLLNGIRRIVAKLSGIE